MLGKFLTCGNERHREGFQRIAQLEDGRWHVLTWTARRDMNGPRYGADWDMGGIGHATRAEAAAADAAATAAAGARGRVALLSAVAAKAAASSAEAELERQRSAATSAAEQQRRRRERRALQAAFEARQARSAEKLAAVQRQLLGRP